jgi:hypothetical protein
MKVSRVVPEIVHGGGVEHSRRSSEGPGFTATLKGEIAKSAAATPTIVPRGTPNNLLKPGDLIDLGGGVYYNTGNRTYQDLTGSIVGLNGASVQQYTDPETYLVSGAAYQPSDAQLRNTVPNLNAIVPPSVGSPTFILNARWSYERTWGAPPLTVSGNPAWTHQANPVPLMPFPGVLKAPGPPPLAGKIPAPWGSEPECA